MGATVSREEELEMATAPTPGMEVISIERLVLATGQAAGGAGKMKTSSSPLAWVLGAFSDESKSCHGDNGGGEEESGSALWMLVRGSRRRAADLVARRLEGRAAILGAGQCGCD